ncbi:MAG: hypothetical protein HQ530_00770 [Parcubacteria group bacterium]|nr:hypothetical protein [Parcubacteria group bacterium]
MKNRIVKLITPVKSSCDNLINISKSRVPISATTKTVYDTVDFFENNIFLKDELKIETEPVKHKTALKEIINLHNNDGIKDVTQIKRMVQKIESGDDILHINRMPNIKLVKTTAAEWVLFDGHHSMLAYMLAGKKYLHEVPQLVVLDEEKGYISAEEILVFFGEHSKKLKGSAWRKKVINWQAAQEKQLGQRIQVNMGELLKSIIFF